MTRTTARATFVAAVLGSALLTGCYGGSSGGEVDEDEAVTLEIEAKSAGRGCKLMAHLSGDEEVPPRETPAWGLVKVTVAKGGQAIHYKLMVRNIKNVIAAHIHLAPQGQNGEVVVLLFGPAAPGGGRTNGR